MSVLPYLLIIYTELEGGRMQEDLLVPLGGVLELLTFTYIGSPIVFLKG